MSTTRPDSRAPLHHLERHLFEPDPPVIDPHDAVVLMEAGSERTEAELVASEVLVALRDGVDPGEIVVVCRSLDRSAELFERALGRYEVPTTSARRAPLGHTALGRALLGLVRYALQPGSQRNAEDLIAYLRHPGIAATEAVDLFEREVRREGGRTGSALRMCGPALRPAMAELERLRLAPQRLAAIAPARVSCWRRRTVALRGPWIAAEQLDARAAAAVFKALEELEQLGEERIAAAELIELLEGLQVPAHGARPAGAVLIAEPLAIRARRFRRVFVTGLCEGEFPSPQAAATDPFLGDDRRRELALGTGLVLAQPTDPLDRERYLLYACVSRATERVVFSYRSSDEDGNIVIASPFLDDIAELFPPDWRAQRRRRLLADVVWSTSEAPTERERMLAEPSRRHQPAGARTWAGHRRAGSSPSRHSDMCATVRSSRRARSRRLPPALSNGLSSASCSLNDWSPIPTRSHADPSSTPCSSACTRDWAARSPRRRFHVRKSCSTRRCAARRRPPTARSWRWTRRPRSALRSCAGSRRSSSVICVRRPPTAATGRRS